MKLALGGMLLILVCAGCGATVKLASDQHRRSLVVEQALKLRSRHCFASPQACGYPDRRSHYPQPSYVGPHDGVGSLPCSSLRRTGTLVVRRAGARIHDVRVNGRIQVDAPNVTIDNVCVSYNGRGSINTPAAVAFDASGGVVENSVVGGANGTNESVQIALGESVNRGYQLTADHDFLYNCSECVHNDGWTLENSEVLANGRPCEGYAGHTCLGAPDHTEDVYCDTGPETVRHDTLFNPNYQTAIVFCNTNNGEGSRPCANQLSITDNLMAGGGFVLYSCAHASSLGSSRLDFRGNDLARCGRRLVYQAATGGRTCGRLNRAATNGRGYWPQGGYYGISAYTFCAPLPGQRWVGNFWDDNHGVVRCYEAH